VFNKNTLGTLVKLFAAAGNCGIRYYNSLNQIQRDEVHGLAREHAIRVCNKVLHEFDSDQLRRLYEFVKKHLGK
jgi:hypothetical protein